MIVDFKVVSKGRKGPGGSVPFVSLVSDNGDKLSLNLDTVESLEEYEIDSVFTMKFVEGEQKTLDNVSEADDADGSGKEDE